MTQVATITHRQSRFTLACRDVVDASGHKHAANGQFGSGGSAKAEDKPKKKLGNAAEKPAAVGKPVNNPDEFEKKHYSKWQEGLSPIEKDAVKRYTGGSYYLINKALRDGTNFKKPEYATIANSLDAILAKTSAPETFETYRAVGPGVLDKLQIGKTFTDKGFLSTSLKLEAFTPTEGSTHAIMHITVPKGAKGAAISQLSEEQDEHEFLLPRNSKIVISAIKQNKGISHVYATVKN